MNLLIVSLVALLFIFVLSQIADHVLHIYNDNFYRPFHFAGGIFTTFLAYSLTNNYLLAFLACVLVGILWEAYEWSLWKFVPRFHNKLYKPKVSDTQNDIIDDTLGAIVALFIVYVFL